MISIIELALHNGYEWQPKKGKTLPVLYNARFDDHIVVKNPNDPANQVYFQTGSYADRGTLINFVSNRLNACFTQFNNPNRSTFQCVNDVLKDYAGLNVEKKQTLKKIENYIQSAHQQTGTEKQFAVEQYKLNPLTPKNYLTQQRHIHQELLTSAQFAETVLSQRLYFDEGKPVPLGPGEMPPDQERVVTNVAFPYQRAGHDAIVGLETRNANFKSHAVGSDKNNGIWISNPVQSDASGGTPKLMPPRRLLVTESAIDSLSFRQLEIMTGLHPKADCRYASAGGSFGPSQINIIREFCDPRTQLVLGFDNDSDGSKMTLNALIELSKDQLSQATPSQPKYVALQIQSETLQRVLSDLVISQTNDTARATENLPDTLKRDLDENVLYWKADARVPTLEIPLKAAIQQRVNQVLIDHGTFHQPVTIARPRGKDFNEDLKEELLRQVKRPILIIYPEAGQLIYRAKDEETARQFIDKELVKSGKLGAMPIGTRLSILRANADQLSPTPMGEIRVTSTGIEKAYSEPFKSAANRQRHEPQSQNQQSL